MATTEPYITQYEETPKGWYFIDALGFKRPFLSKDFISTPPQSEKGEGR